MSQTFFSKQDATETLSRLSLLGNSKGTVTLWPKGQKEKLHFEVSKFDKDRMEIVLDSKEAPYALGQTVLCAFELRGMNFFSEVIFQVSIGGHCVLQFKNTLFKSERRNSYRLMTYPIYDVVAEFDVGEGYEGGKVFDLKSKTNQTGIFKSFLNLVDPSSKEASASVLKIRVQDLSTTGMAIHASELEQEYFSKGTTFKNVAIVFKDETIVVPEVRVVYLVDYISHEKSAKKYKVGLHFDNLSTVTDEAIGKKINSLLRENDFNKDFENFIK